MNPSLNKSKLKKSNNQIKLYLKQCEDLNSFIIKKYLYQIKNNKILIVNYDNLKNFESLEKIFEYLDIKKLDLMKIFFEKNFIKRDKKNINELKYKEYYKSFRILKKFSLL